jgi:uncharacterized protein
MYESNKTRLKEIIRIYDSLVVAFSGGTDSTLLGWLGYQILKEKLLLVHVVSPFTPASETDFVNQWSLDNNIRLENIAVNPLDEPQIRLNCRKRCYYCKLLIMDHISKKAKETGFSAIADGSNLDDLEDFRPGFEACAELQVKHPFIEAGFTKQMIRDYACELNIPNWRKPASACLASRIPYDTPIEDSTLRKIDFAEAFLLKLGFEGCRVRVIDNIVAKIEVYSRHFDNLVSSRKEIVEYFTGLGFIEVCLDLKGYRKGALNEYL